MATLRDRQFQTTRVVRPGRTVEDKFGEKRFAEEAATAVVSPDGDSILEDASSLLRLLLLETRRTNALLELLVGEEVRLSEVA